MDLFEYNLQKRGTQDAPLAARMRPTTLEEFVGQEQIVGKINCFTVPLRVTDWVP